MKWSNFLVFGRPDCFPHFFHGRFQSHENSTRYDVVSDIELDNLIYRRHCSDVPVRQAMTGRDQQTILRR
jgi:hypothetical protein